MVTPTAEKTAREIVGPMSASFATRPDRPLPAASPMEPTTGSFKDDHAAPLSELFGYYEDSESNTLGLLRRVVCSPSQRPRHGIVVHLYVNCLLGASTNTLGHREAWTKANEISTSLYRGNSEPNSEPSWSGCLRGPSLTS